MKKTLRKYQGGGFGTNTLQSSSSAIPYTGFSSQPSTSLYGMARATPSTPNLATSTNASGLDIKGDAGLKGPSDKGSEGGGGGASAMGYVGAAANLATGIAGTVMDANKTIEDIQTSQTGYNNYLKGEAANKILNLGKKEGSQLESSNVYKGSFDPNMASQDIAHERAIAQEKISKDSTSTGLSFIPFVGQIAAGINDAVWSAGMEERALTYRNQKAMSGKEQSSFGGTGEELRRGKYGGRMPVYKMGGSRSYQRPNAELEDGEVIMRNGGGVKIIKGDRHEEGGEDEYLAPGDFVWSDHLKYKGKSMAELYLMVKDSPEKVNQLKDLQEDLASKEEPSEYNDLPQKKCGGGLPKYQAGTPTATYRPYQLPTTESTTTGSFPFTRPQYNMFGQFEGGGTGMRGISMRQSVINQANAAAAAQALQEQKVAKANAAKAKAKASVPAQVPVVPAPIAAPAAAYNPNGPLATYASVNGPGYGMNGPLTDYASVYGPGAGYTNASVKETGKTQRAVGEKSKTEQFLGKYGPSIAAGLGGVGQLFALGLAKNPFENLSVPNAAQLSSAQFTALGRNNDEAFKNAAMSGYRALLDDARYRGAGPGDMSQGQMAYNRAMQEIEAAQRGVMASNINLAATEAELNQSNNLEVKKFNAAAKNAQIENELALNSARASFEGQKPGLIAGAIGTTVSDALNFYKDQQKAKAIYGNTSLEKDHYGVDMQAINKKAWQVAEEKAKLNGKTATYADYYKEVSGLLDLLPKQ